MAAINFFYEGVSFKIPHPRKTSAWIKESIKKEKHTLLSLNFIFCTDEYLLDINVQFLNHKTFTDIITFDQSEGRKAIEGEIYISIDRVKENAIKYDGDFDQELHRVIIHGILHLIGYTDKGDKSKIMMRKKEDAYLSLR